MYREAIIPFCGQTAKVICDSKCNKAWGYSSRPHEKVTGKEDDIMWYADHELGEAPKDPGSYEGTHGKPESPDEFPNKWCVRECERCEMSNPGEYNKPLELTNWDERVYNIKRR